jgi:nitroreductase
MLETLRARRSIRAYTGQPLDEATIDLLKEALLRAPSSRNLRPSRFFFIRDRQLLELLSTAKSQHAAPLAGAAIAVVVCGDESVSDCWIEDCSIASIILQLAATELGLGSCWIQLRGREDASGHDAEQRTRALLGLPQELRVLSAIAIGHPAEDKHPVPTEQLGWDRVSDNLA